MTAADVWAVLGEVTDPEYPMSIVDLGMVYAVRAEHGRVTIEMTFTSIGCPAIDMILTDIREAVMQLGDVTDVQIDIVWYPPWTKECITDRGRRILELHGVVS